MKLLFKLIKIAIIFVFIGALFYLFINKTFVYNVYKNNDIEKGINIKRFMYVVENDMNMEFYTFWPSNSLEKERDGYLSKLDNCYGKYYYDKDNDITITNYDIVDKKYYRYVYIEYVKDNYCSEKYQLSDMWVYEYNSLSAYLNGDLSDKAMSKLIDKVYNSKRVNPVVDDYESQYNLVVNCDKNKEEYSLVISDFNDDLLLVKKVMGSDISFAVYEVLNVKEYLKELIEYK